MPATVVVRLTNNRTFTTRKETLVDRQLGFIADLDSVMLGRIVKKAALAFDTDPGLRFDLVSRGETRSAIPLSEWEYNEEYGDRKRLRDWPSRIIYRERLRIYLYILDVTIDMVEGRNVPKIITPENETRVYQAEDLRSYWLSEPGYAAKVRALRDVLGEAVDTFSQQLVLRWVRKATERYCIGDHPSFVMGLTQEEMVRTYSAVEDYSYRTGRFLMSNKCGEAYDELASMPQAYTANGRPFFFTPRELEFLFRLAIGGKGGVEEFAAIEPDLPERPAYGWLILESGLIVPA